ncbi:MAG: hypothetical protein LC804_26465 [Acidobacteria bacterium]|nr:hypothetical protein [Acidobacteriota bacterium]
MAAALRPRLRRPLLVAAVLLMLGAAGIALIVRWALDPRAVRGAAEARLSAMLGQPVTIGDIRIELLPAAALVGSDVRVGAGRDDAPSLDLQRIRIVPRLRSLFRRPVVIQEVRLDGLVGSVLRDRSGAWHVPTAVPAPGADEQRGMVIERVRLQNGRLRVFEQIAGGGREASSIDEVAAEVVADGGTLRLSPMSGRIGGAAITGEAVMDAKAALLDFTLAAIGDGDLPALLRLAGAERPEFLHLPTPASASLAIRIDRATSRLAGTGALRAPQVSLGTLELRGLEAPLNVDGRRLTFTPTTFAFYGGTHRGTIAVDMSPTPSRWSLDSRLADLDLGDFLAALTARDQQIDGTAAMTGVLRGRVGEPLNRTVQGRLQVTVVNGVVRQFPLLAAVNRALRLAEGDMRDTRFDRLTATLAIAGGRAMTNALVLQAREVRVEAAGHIDFDRSLDLTGQVMISASRSADAIRSVRELSALRNAQGELQLPLAITGTLDNPLFKVDLTAAVGKSLRDELRRRLRGIFRPPPRSADRRHSQAAAASGHVNR